MLAATPRPVARSSMAATTPSGNSMSFGNSSYRSTLSTANTVPQGHSTMPSYNAATPSMTASALRSRPSASMSAIPISKASENTPYQKLSQDMSAARAPMVSSSSASFKKPLAPSRSIPLDQEQLDPQTTHSLMSRMASPFYSQRVVVGSKKEPVKEIKDADMEERSVDEQQTTTVPPSSRKKRLMLHEEVNYIIHSHKHTQLVQKTGVRGPSGTYPNTPLRRQGHYQGCQKVSPRWVRYTSSCQGMLCKFFDP